MKTRFLANSLAMVLLSALFCSVAQADQLAGFSDVTVEGGAIVSLRYEGTEYVVANGDLMLGTTTRWYVPAATGVETLWAEGDATPAATVPGTSNPKGGDVGSKGDNFLFTLNGSTNISSIDGIDFQETIFPLPTDTIFVFERGGNDKGTFQAILQDGSLGAPVAFNGTDPYKNTGVSVNGQNAFGVVFTTDVPVKGVRITAGGHDTLSISALPIRVDPKQSRDPQPADEATDVPRDVVLSWTPGEGVAAVNGHVVYLSTNINDVNDGIGGVTLSDTSFEPGPLDFGATYYWRVDEVGADVFRGAVWSFTVEPFSYPVANVKAIASSAQVGMGPENTVNGSGLNADDGHSNDGAQMWLSAGVQPNWIQFEFDKIYKLDEMWVWNSNQLVEKIVGFGAKDVTIEYSTDGSTWTELANVPPFEQADGSDGYVPGAPIDLGGILAKYVKLTIKSTWGGLAQCGLSEVRFLYIPTYPREPQPASGQADVDPAAVLSWRAGREAASHKLYFSAEADAVTDGTALVDTMGENRYDLDSLNLELNTTYYWKVVEVNEAAAPSSWEGDVWEFSTQESVVVDDFESYTNDSPDRVFQTWIDGAGFSPDEFFPQGNNGNGTGSLIGYDPAAGDIMERAIVHGGKQSMPFYYDNAAGARSEGQRTFDEPQDWSRNGIAKLELFFHGDANNVSASLYVKINGKKVLYDNGAAGTAFAEWKRWTVDLASVGTNLKSVTTLVIGIEGTGSGIVYVDDIRLRPADRLGPPVITVGPANAVNATGDNGQVQSIDGIDVSALVLGKTVAAYEKYADHPAAHADDFDLGTYASLDESPTITVTFAVPVTTIFIIERGANDLGLIQPFDAAGQPVGGAQTFEKSHWFKPGVKIGGQDAGAIVITSAVPISGITLLPATGGVTGIDPASICGVPAQ